MDSQAVDFLQLAMQDNTLPKTETFFDRLHNKDNIALICLLKLADHSATTSKERKNSKQVQAQHLLLANSHIHWNPSFTDVKLLQMALLLRELETFERRHAKLFKNGKCPAIICGDLNSLPDSGVYEFLSKGKVAAFHPDFSNIDYGNYTSDGLKHSFHPLKSAYEDVNDTSSFRYTNYTPGFKGIIDHTFYTATSLQVQGLLAGYDETWTKTTLGFPNMLIPSDHILTLCKLKII